MKLSRRRFTAGLGASLLAAPFASLLTRRARAQVTGARARRLVVFFTPNGTVHRFWRPSGTETDFTFPAGGMLEPLDGWRHRMVLLDELDFFSADNHEGGMAAMLTNNGGGKGGVTGGASVDQWIARHVGDGTRLASLELGVQTSAWGGGVQTRMSYSGTDRFVTPDDDPRHAFTRVFGDAAGGAGALDRQMRLRRSVLDVNRAELADLRERLGTEERRKLDAHLDSLRTVERELTALPSSTCERPAAPEQRHTDANGAFPDIARAQVDVAVQALACGLTRVASIQLSHTVGDRVYDWAGAHEGHHSLSHVDDGQPEKLAQLVAAERWNATLFARLLQGLSDAPDPETGGSLLDDTLVLWAKELGDSRLHTCRSVPWVLAGGGGGTLRQGRWLRLGGAHHAKALVWLTRAFGLDNDTFGNPDAGSGALEQL